MNKLLKSSRFGPFFWTQFWGAFNDNLYKNALLLWVAATATSESESGLVSNLAAALFILPFLLLSPLAGQLAEKFEKAALIRKIKLGEIVVMALGGLALLWENIGFLLVVLFLMGTQSTFFGPIKYSILPQALKEEELMSGTSWVELGTFVAILLGTIFGLVLIEQGVPWVMLAIIGIAALGYWHCRQIPVAPAVQPQLRINYNPLTEVKNLYQISRRVKSVFLSLLAISWFWFVGALILAQMPTFVLHTVQGHESLINLFFAIFTLSIAVGSYVSDKLSDSSIELGLVPLGAVGISWFLWDLACLDYSSLPNGLGIGGILWTQASTTGYRIVFNMLGLGFFSAFYIVPLYAMLQHRSDPAETSRVIAANNILNALFMVASALLAILVFHLGFTTLDLYSLVAALNLLVFIYMLKILPEFVLRFGIWILARTVYSLSYQGRQNIPRQGGIIVVANHVSFIDWLVVSAACQRPVRFVMYHKIYNLPVLKWLFKMGGCIPIAPARESRSTMMQAFNDVSQTLEDGDPVGLFPEGGITQDGQLAPFKPGVEKMLERNPVQVVPIVIDGLWGSFFSRFRGNAMSGIPRPRRRSISVRILPPLPAENVTAQTLQELFEKELAAKV